MNKKKEVNNFKKIISITKEKSINKLKSGKKIQKNKINNINLHNDKKDNITKNIEKKEKRLEISFDKQNKVQNREDINERNNYFDFKAHFKYNDLVDALSSLINNNQKKSKISSRKEKNNNRLENPKVISRNVMFNNYAKYMEFIKESNPYEILTNIPTKIKKNKTSYLPQTELIKNNIIFKFRKFNEKNNNNKKIFVSKSKSKSKSNEKKYSNRTGKISKEKYSNYNHKKYNNLINISLIKRRKNKNSSNNRSTNNSNNKSRSVSKKRKRENKTNNNNKNKIIKNNKYYNIKRDTFQHIKNDINNKINKSEISNNINKKNNNKIYLNMSKKGKSKEKQNKITNIINLNYNPNNNISDIRKKAHSTSLPRAKNKILHKTNKIKNIHEVNNIKTINKNNISKNKKKITNDAMNLSKPFGIKKTYNKKIKLFNELNNFKMRLIFSNHSNNITSYKLNNWKENSTEKTLAITTLNNIKNSHSKSKSKKKENLYANTKIKKVNTNKIKLIGKIEEKNDKTIKNDILINKMKKGKITNNKNSFKRENEVINNKKIKQNFIKKISKSKNKNNSKNKRNYYDSFQSPKSNNITETKIPSYKKNNKKGIYLFFNEQNIKKSNKTRIINIKNLIDKNNKCNPNISRNYIKAYKTINNYAKNNTKI